MYTCGRFLLSFFIIDPKILLWIPWLLLWPLLIKFLSKFGPKCSRGCLGSSCGRFSFTSYSNLIQNTPLAALPPPAAASYSLLIKIQSKILL